ncbi:protein ASPARTIC PROTEASE IN GUARD CELL 1-like [Abrus precatorius]|uniref:Protein ASPARTIC PROTEASE IN GUARD CELL 1-like n=1 Tax=Abrus precatorius TaxID=3816 RepID=A0A8B8K1J2_ABRPR|nr:protein ASPARTIC PROTEASE IN GUARD CELL 1-like [Abrus precatorius]
MVTKVSLILVFLAIFSINFKAYTEVDDQNDHNNDPPLTNSEYTNCLNFDALPCLNSCCDKKAKSSEPTRLNKEEDKDDAISTKPHRRSVKLHLKRRPIKDRNEPKTHVLDSTIKDLVRIQTLHRKVLVKNNINNMSRVKEVKEQLQQQIKPVNASVESLESSEDEFSGKIMATLESGASLGSGEYFIDMFVGTPPKHVCLILDTGSDLTWIQCVPCYDCFEQNGFRYDPKDSSSYRNITCHDPLCQLVSSLDPLQPCKVENQTCPYFYGYADGSNTRGDFALETFTVNLTWPNGKENFKHVVDVMFGCGHWNTGFFHGAAGLLGLGRGPLSFSTQMQSIYGNSFSYCLTDLFSNTSVSSKLIFGEDKELLYHPNLNFTSLLAREESPYDTFYYLGIKSILVGGEMLDIPEQTWHWSSEGDGGTIIDSGSTLTFSPGQAYDVIKEAFMKKIKLHPIAEDGFIMSPCYNVSGALLQVELPDFGIHFADGAVWNFPVENYFYHYESDEVLCLAILKSPNHSSLTIIGNLLQQNFHILYDTKKSRLGYSPRRCAEV